MSIAKDVLKQMGGRRERRSFFTATGPGQVERHSGDAGKVKQISDWKPAMTWKQGLEATIEWYTANRPWWEKHIWMRQIPIITASGRKEYH